MTNFSKELKGSVFLVINIEEGGLYCTCFDKAKELEGKAFEATGETETFNGKLCIRLKTDEFIDRNMFVYEEDLLMIQDTKQEMETEEMKKQEPSLKELEDLLGMALFASLLGKGKEKSKEPSVSFSLEEELDNLFTSLFKEVQKEVIKKEEEQLELPFETETETEVSEEEATYVITEDSLTLHYKGSCDTINRDSSDFNSVRQAVLEGRYADAYAKMNKAVGIKDWSGEKLVIDNGIVTFEDMPLTGSLVNRIVDMMEQEDDSFKGLAKFLEMALEQPSFQTRNRLMEFASHGKLDINEDGMIVAFKNVREDYYDKHSRSFRNMVGDSPSMDRSQVNDNHDITCAEGLHVCAPEYLRSFWGTSGKTMKVIVDPRDMVAVPFDYNNTKARVCKYTVVEDVTDKINDYL